jgi:hypothetical protein
VTREQLRQYAVEWMLERAAIVEYDAGVPRAVAERRAVAQWNRLRRTDLDLQVSEIG